MASCDYNVQMKLCSSLFLIFLLAISTLASAMPQVDLVVVKKSEAKLYLLKEGKVFKEYDVALGAHPKGPKLKKGDKRTPEGRYILDYKNAHSAFYKSIHISYTNKIDREHARRDHLYPGGDIMIHRKKNGFGWLSFILQHFNWTNGCIAVTNEEMDEIWQTVKVGTPIEIRP